MAHARLTSLLALTASLCTIAVGAIGGATASAFADGSCANANLTPTSGNVEQVRAAVLCLINQEREHHGEAALVANAKLARAAQAHSRDMAEQDYFSHIAPDGSTPLQRMRANGYLPNSQDGYVVGENIAWGTMWLATPQSIVGAWMASPGHRANILDGAYRETGVGVEPRPPASLAEGQPGAIYTQDFGVVIPAGHSSRHVAGGAAGHSSSHTSSESAGHSSRHLGGRSAWKDGGSTGRDSSSGGGSGHRARHRRHRHKHHRRHHRHRHHAHGHSSKRRP